MIHYPLYTMDTKISGGFMPINIIPTHQIDNSYFYVGFRTSGGGGSNSTNYINIMRFNKDSGIVDINIHLLK